MPLYIVEELGSGLRMPSNYDKLLINIIDNTY